MNQQPQVRQPTQGGTRPGAMTMAMQAVQLPTSSGPKVLRIGLIQKGKIVEERIIRRRETVSVGTSERNHFIIQNPDLPSRFELFQLVGNDYLLNFTDKMTGRVALPGGVQQLQDLRSTGGARNAGSHWQIKLSDSSRGKVAIGDVTLLFQFVVPPPIQPRPQLPAAARGGFVKSIDWTFTAFIVFSYMAFFGGIIFLENYDYPIAQGLTEVPESVARLIFEEPQPPPEEEKTEDAKTEEKSEDQPAQQEERPQQTKQERPSAAEERPAADAANNAEERARIASEAAEQAVNMLLGSIGSGGDFADLLAGGAVTGNMEDVIAQARGVGVATRGQGALNTRSGGGGSGQTGALGSLAAAGGSGATQQAGEGVEVVERRIRGKTQLESGGDIGGSGEFDAAIVVRTIRTRLKAIQMCYETELRRTPTLQGKVTVQFTIETSGSVTGVRAAENTSGNSALASCVVGTVQRFRFNPGPDGGSVTFSYPFVFAPQN